MAYFMIRCLVGAAIAICLMASFRVQPSRTNTAIAQIESRELHHRTGTEGTLTGRILYRDEVPVRKKIVMSQDPVCASIARSPRTEDIIVTNGNLANVFVYLKGAALEKYSFETPLTAVVLDQRLCRFAPRILGIQTGQTLFFLNSDATTHNIHPTPKVNQEWNQMQAKDAMPIEKAFTRVETMIPIKCNQHPWMKAYVGVLAHPFFAVSGKSGSFKIDGLPPGEYTLVAWHEVFGEQTTSVSIEPMNSKSIELVYPVAAGRSTTYLKTERPVFVEQQ